MRNLGKYFRCVIYGTLGISLSMFLIFIMSYFEIGSGVTVYNRKREMIIISRKLFPTLNRWEMKLRYTISFFAVASLNVLLVYGKEGRLVICKKSGNIFVLSEERSKYKKCYLKGNKLARYITKVLLEKSYVTAKTKFLCKKKLLNVFQDLRQSFSIPVIEE